MVRRLMVLFLDMCSDVSRGTEKRSGPHFRLFVTAPLVNWMLVNSMNSARPRGSLSELCGFPKRAVWKRCIGQNQKNGL